MAGFSDTAQLGVEIKSSGGNETITMLQILANQAHNTEIGIKNLTSAVNTHGTAQRTFVQGNKDSEMSVGQLALRVAGYSSVLMAGIQVTRAITSEIVNLAKESVVTAAQFEKWRVQWSVLMGDVQQGSIMFEKIYDLSRRSPLTTQGVMPAAQMLRAFGVEAQNLIPLLEQLGNLSMGDDEKLRLIAKSYGEMFSMGHVQARNMIQMVRDGVPIYDALAESMGKTREQISEMVTQGKIGINEINGAIKLLTSETGRFNDMMDKVSETLSGKWSVAVDTFKQLLASIGEDTLPVLKSALDSFIKGAEKALAESNLIKVMSGSGGDITSALAYANSQLMQAKNTEMSTPEDLVIGPGPAYWQSVIADLQQMKLEMGRLNQGSYIGGKGSQSNVPKPWEMWLEANVGDFYQPGMNSLRVAQVFVDAQLKELSQFTALGEDRSEDYAKIILKLRDEMIKSGLWVASENAIQYLTQQANNLVNKNFTNISGYYPESASLQESLFSTFPLMGFQLPNPLMGYSFPPMPVAGEQGLMWRVSVPSEEEYNNALLASYEREMREREKWTAVNSWIKSKYPYAVQPYTNWDINAPFLTEPDNYNISGYYPESGSLLDLLFASMPLMGSQLPNPLMGYSFPSMPMTGEQSLMGRVHMPSEEEYNNTLLANMYEQEKWTAVNNWATSKYPYAARPYTNWDNTGFTNFWDVNGIPRFGNPEAQSEAWAKWQQENYTIMRQRYIDSQRWREASNLAFQTQNSEEYANRLMFMVNHEGMTPEDWWNSRGAENNALRLNPEAGQEARDAAMNALGLRYGNVNQLGYQISRPSDPFWFYEFLGLNKSLMNNEILSISNWPENPLPLEKPWIQESPWGNENAKWTALTEAYKQKYPIEWDQFIEAQKTISMMEANLRVLESAPMQYGYPQEGNIKPWQIRQQNINALNLASGDIRGYYFDETMEMPFDIKIAITDQEKLTEALAKYKAMLDSGSISQEGYNQLIREAKESLDPTIMAQVELTKTFDDLAKKMVSTAFSGALKDFEKIGEIMAGNKDAANTMGDSLRQAMLDIVDMLPQMLLQAGLQLIFSGNPAMMGTGVALIVASGLVAIGAGAANYAASQEAQTTPLVASAKGNVFASPSLSMYENGVYNTPHYFKFANGGVFGEAGYEAIMPLTRSVSGQLGVRGNVAPVNVQVVNNVGATVSTKETTNADGSRQLQILIDKAVNSAISRGKADKAMGSRYGTRVAATQRM